MDSERIRKILRDGAKRQETFEQKIIKQLEAHRKRMKTDQVKIEKALGVKDEDEDEELQ